MINMKTTASFLFLFLLCHSAVSAQSVMAGLNRFTGEWKSTYTMWMSPSMPAMTDHLTARATLEMNELFFVIRYNGVVMEMEYEGLRTIGYDLVKKKFVSAFTDNMNSGIDYKEGTGSLASGLIELAGTGVDAASGKPIQTKDVITLSDRQIRIETYELLDGVERKIVETLLTR